MRHSIGAAILAVVTAAVLSCSPASAAPRLADQASAATLAWDTLSTTASPSARSDPALTYDGASGYLLLFGGTAPGGEPLDDTWEFDGTSWTQLQPAQSPPPLSGASMAYDSSLGQLLLFGGNTPQSGGLGPSSQTWAWNGASWTLQSPATTPPARFDATLTGFDSAAGGSFVLFGGVGAPQATTPTTTASSTTTSTVAQADAPTDGPIAVPNGTIPTSSSLVEASASGEVSASPATLDDTWVWTGANWSQEPASSTDPPARASAAAAWDPALGEVVLFGGSSDGTDAVGSLLGDQWAWSGQAWSELQPTSLPPALRGAAFSNDPVSGADVLIDGWGQDGPADGVWEYSNGRWAAVAAASPQPSSSGVAAAWDIATSQIVVFDGSGVTGALRDTPAIITATAPARATTTPPTAAAPSPSTTSPAVPTTHRGRATSPTHATVTTLAPSTTLPPLARTTTPHRTTPVIAKPASQPPAIVALTTLPASISSGTANGPIAASRSSSHPGQQVVVTGSGYAPRSKVAIWFHSTPVLLGNATADAAGRFDVEVTVPANAAPGNHHFEAEGMTSSGKVELFTVGVHVTLPGPPGRSHAESVALLLIAIGIPVATWGSLAMASRRRKRTAAGAGV